jgi:hypothetical protein
MAVPKNPLESFIWGEGGAALTPEEIARRREMEQAILAKGGIDTSPVGHWAEGLARVANAAAGSFRRGQLEKAATENASYNDELIKALTGGASSSTSSMPATTGAGNEVAATSPAPIDMTGNEVYSQFMDTVKGGVQNPYALAAIAATGNAESGWSPGNVNRTWSDPSESGQAGRAGGIMSWRGPRYQALAATGDLSPAGQARFFLQENPDLIAKLNSAKSVEEAQTLMNNAWAFAGYNRPGGEAARRLSLAKGYLPTFGTETAAATPQAAIEAVAPGSGYVDPVVSAPNYQPPVSGQPLPDAAFNDRFAAPAAPMVPETYSPVEAQPFAPPLPEPTTIANAPAVASVPPQQVAQAAPQQNMNADIIRALSDPRASDSTRRVAQVLLQQQFARDQAAQEQQTWMARQDYERQQQANDPLRQLQIRKAQIEVDSANNPKPQPLLNAGNGAIYDPNNKSWIQAPSSGSQFRQAAPEEAAKYGAPGGQFGPDGRFYPINPPSGTSLSVDPNTGAVTFNQGAGVKPLTEAQSKDSFFTTRMTGAVPTIDRFETALQSLPEAAAGAIPMNLGRYAQSEEYQLAKDAGDDFVAAYLRKDSGAALTEEEKRQYGTLLLPQPGDKPAVIEAKRIRRRLAVEAIKSGMPSNAIDGTLRAIQAVPGADQPAKTGREINGYKIEEVTE